MRSCDTSQIVSAISSVIFCRRASTAGQLRGVRMAMCATLRLFVNMLSAQRKYRAHGLREDKEEEESENDDEDKEKD